MNHLIQRLICLQYEVGLKIQDRHRLYIALVALVAASAPVKAWKPINSDAISAEQRLLHLLTCFSCKAPRLFLIYVKHMQRLPKRLYLRHQ